MIIKVYNCMGNNGEIFIAVASKLFKSMYQLRKIMLCEKAI